MNTTKQTLRTPFLGKQRSCTAASPGNTADAPKHTAKDPAISTPRVVVKTRTSEELFGLGNELSIAHRGERYSLRITGQGKLILTK
jgi:hemin uptake protein HemP